VFYAFTFVLCNKDFLTYLRVLDRLRWPHSQLFSPARPPTLSLSLSLYCIASYHRDHTLWLAVYTTACSYWKNRLFNICV